MTKKLEKGAAGYHEALKALWPHRRIMWVAPQFILRNLLNPMIKDGCIYCTWMVDSLHPVGSAYIHHVFYDHMRNSFGFILLNEEWSAVPDGEEPPTINLMFHRKRFKLADPLETGADGEQA